jgi:hypothetical protein
VRTLQAVTGEAAEAASAGDLEKVKCLLDERESLVANASPEVQTEAYCLGVALAVVLKSTRRQWAAEQMWLVRTCESLPSLRDSLPSAPAVNLQA